jgi:hypothetical protein
VSNDQHRTSTILLSGDDGGAEITLDMTKFVIARRVYHQQSVFDFSRGLAVRENMSFVARVRPAHPIMIAYARKGSLLLVFFFYSTLSLLKVTWFLFKRCPTSSFVFFFCFFFPPSFRRQRENASWKCEMP